MSIILSLAAGGSEWGNRLAAWCGECGTRGRQFKVARVSGTGGIRISGKRMIRVSGTRNSDLLDVKEYEGIRITSPRAFLDLIS
jgi:hypothetical protein